MLNTGLIIGAGTDFLRYVVRVIKGLYDKKYKNINFKVIILDSWSWHEITLLIFSNSYNRIMEFVLELCDVTIEKSREFLQGDDNSLVKFENSDCLIKEVIEKHKKEYVN